jgi:hypothetical protein
MSREVHVRFCESRGVRFPPATRLFTIPTVRFQTLFVFVLISHARRRIEHVNVTAHPTAEWVWRQLIEATPWGRQPRFLLRDRDRCYGNGFVRRARGIGIEGDPDADCYAAGQRDSGASNRHAAARVPRSHPSDE